MKQFVSKMLRQFADRIDNGTCDMSEEDMQKLCQMITQVNTRQTCKGPSSDAILFQAFGNLSKKVDNLEQRITKPVIKVFRNNV